MAANYNTATNYNMAAISKSPWRKAGWAAVSVFLSLELIGMAFGWFVGFEFMHGRMKGFDGALVFAIASLYASIPA